MKLIAKIAAVVVLLGIAGKASQPWVTNWWKERNRVTFRTASVEDGTIREVIIATGEVKPVLEVQVGTFVSGPIAELHADFNDEVRKGDLLAKVDPQIYDAAVARDRAALANRQADVARVEAQLQRAERDLERARGLREENPDYISDTEMDRYRFERLGLVAQLGVANAGVDQARANLLTSEANVGYTKITSPVDGMVINRLIDEGQTLAAGFQTPQLFTIAPDMRKKMLVYASIDETDLGRVRMAKEWEEANPDEPGAVTLSVQSYPDDVFNARIEEIRMSSTVNQNVVTYPVVLAVANPELKLLPGMTADLTFRIKQREGVRKIPNSALRYLPDIKLVREEDKKLLEGFSEDEEEDDTEGPEMTVEERVEASRKRSKRHVWVEGEDNKLKAVEVIVGINDNRFTELMEGDVDDSTKLVVGVEKKKR